MFSLLRVVQVAPVVPVMEVVTDSREGVADRASNQRAESAADQTACQAATRGLVSGARCAERSARAEADQRSNGRECGWTRGKMPRDRLVRAEAAWARAEIAGTGQLG